MPFDQKAKTLKKNSEKKLQLFCVLCAFTRIEIISIIKIACLMLNFLNLNLFCSSIPPQHVVLDTNLIKRKIGYLITRVRQHPGVREWLFGPMPDFCSLLSKYLVKITLLKNTMKTFFKFDNFPGSFEFVVNTISSKCTVLKVK